MVRGHVTVNQEYTDGHRSMEENLADYMLQERDHGERQREGDGDKFKTIQNIILSENVNSPRTTYHGSTIEYITPDHTD